MQPAQHEWIETAFSRLEEIEAQRSRLDAEYRRLFEAVEALADADPSEDTADPQLPDPSLAAHPVEWDEFSPSAWAYDSESVVAPQPVPISASEPAGAHRRRSARRRAGRASLAMAVGVGLVLGVFGYLRWLAPVDGTLDRETATAQEHGSSPHVEAPGVLRADREAVAVVRASGSDDGVGRSKRARGSKAKRAHKVARGNKAKQAKRESKAARADKANPSRSRAAGKRSKSRRITTSNSEEPLAGL